MQLPDAPILRGDQSVIQHAPSLAAVTDPTAWHLAPPPESSPPESAPEPQSAAGGGQVHSAAAAALGPGRLGASPGFNQTGIHHSSIVELLDGTFAAIGREQAVGGFMPWSHSVDGGYTWSMRASPFLPTHGGQRPILRRLGSLDQPLILCSFANDAFPTPCHGTGCVLRITGLFCAVSSDEGRPSTTSPSA